MMKRPIYFFLSLLLLSGSLAAQQKPKARPNVIFIISDDHAYQAISAYGSKLMQTPNIDRIAKAGAILYNNVVTNSICGPSRALLLTGKYSHVNGYKLNEKQFDVNQSTFPETLQKNGYQTAWVGKMHLGNVYGVKGYEKITADLKAQLRAQIVKYKDDEALKIFDADKR